MGNQSQKETKQDLGNADFGEKNPRKYANASEIEGVRASKGKSKEPWKHEHSWNRMFADESKFVEPWRKFESFGDWNKKYRDKLMSDIQSFKSYGAIKYSKLVLLGPVMAGKSSFINSIARIDKDKISQPMLAGSAPKSFTRQLQQYIPKGYLKGPYRIMDTMGIEERELEGFFIQDVIYLMEGNIAPDYEFLPGEPITPTDNPKFILNPTPEDKPQCIVIVIDSVMVDDDSFSEESKKKLRKLQEFINQRHMPIVLVLTKIDEVCEDEGIKISEIYKSRRIKKLVFKAHQIFGVPEMNIYPVQNYSREHALEDNMDILLLLALKGMLNIASDYLERIEDQKPVEEKPWRRFGGWTKEYRTSLAEAVKSFIPHGGVEFVKLVLVGPTRAGKSSFVGSIASIDKNEIVVETMSSITTKMHQYVPKGKLAGKFRLIDTRSMGETGDEEMALNVQDTISLMQGNLAPNYKFNPMAPITPTNYPRCIAQQTKDQAQCTGFVIDSNFIYDVGSIPDELKRKTRQLRSDMQTHEFAVVIILTNIDKICEKENIEITEIFTNRKILQIVEDTSKLFGIPTTNIYPVQNYSRENDLDYKVDILLLMALRGMQTRASEHFEQLKLSKDQNKSSCLLM